MTHVVLGPAPQAEADEGRAEAILPPATTSSRSGGRDEAEHQRGDRDRHARLNRGGRAARVRKRSSIRRLRVGPANCTPKAISARITVEQDRRGGEERLQHYHEADAAQCQYEPQARLLGVGEAARQPAGNKGGRDEAADDRDEQVGKLGLAAGASDRPPPRAPRR